MSSASSSESSRAQLGLWDAISIIVGIIIGATIFRSPALIFGNIVDQHIVAFGKELVVIPALWAGLGVWLLVGLLSIAGALCYAELATAYPTAGGDYTFLTRAYGPGPGFLFAWSEMSIIRTGGSIGAMAYIFGDYAERLLQSLADPNDPELPKSIHDFAANSLQSLGDRTSLTFTVGAVVLITLVNVLGLRPGKLVQNLLTSAKVIGLLAIIVAGGLFFLWKRTPADVVPDTKPVWPFPPSFALAMVFVFYAYGGWHECAYVAAEMRDRKRNITRALLIGVGLVTVIYLAANAAYLAALGLDRVRASKVVAADVMALPLGPWGTRLISMLIMISALGAINGLMFTGIRLYSTFGSHERLFQWLSRRGFAPVPLGALLIQTFFTLALIALFEFGDVWKPHVMRACAWLGIGLPEEFGRKAGGFDDLVACTAPVFWLFFTFTGYSVIVLRSRESGVDRPFRVPLFPIVPLLFCGSSLFMLYRSTDFALTKGPAELGVVAAFLLLGIPLYALSGPPAAHSTSAPE